MQTAMKPAIVVLAIACTPPLALFLFGRLWSLDVVWMSVSIIAFVSAPFVVGFATSRVIGYRERKGAVIVVLGSIVSIIIWSFLIGSLIFSSIYRGH